MPSTHTKVTKPATKKRTQMAAQEDDVAAELEAVQAVYGDDCVVVESYPPHLHLHIKPRTADVASQQFVEAVIGIQASSQYPEVLPHIYLIDSKGLDEQRQKLLMNFIREKECELSSCSMLVAIFEEAVEKLSAMNHPDGDCSLCLFPLVPEKKCKVLPFMKLMSCFHCFHSECIIRWWSWNQTERKLNASSSTHSIRDLRDKKDKRGDVKESMANCPICRKVFHTEDLDHVLNLVDNHSSQPSLAENEDDDCEKILLSDMEKSRREIFEAVFKLQQENCGLVEPKKSIAIVPGMFLPPPVAPSDSVPAKESAEEPPVTSGMHLGGSSGRPNTNEWRSSNSRKQREQRVRNPRRPAQQWMRKESDNA